MIALESMDTRGPALGLALVVLSSCFCCAAQSHPQKPVSPIEIVAVKSNSVDVKLRSVWPYPVSVWVCDTPRRLNELGYYLEAYTGKKWKRLEAPKGRVFGDMKPEYLEIGEDGTRSLPASVYPAAFGAKRTLRLRIVVRAWRSERNVVGVLSPVNVNEEPLLLTSAPFVLKPYDGNSQQ
jgi:hypothetical protein